MLMGAAGLFKSRERLQELALGWKCGPRKAKDAFKSASD